jgi:hypothetical protein
MPGPPPFAHAAPFGTPLVNTAPLGRLVSMLRLTPSLVGTLGLWPR